MNRTTLCALLFMALILPSVAMASDDLNQDDAIAVAFDHLNDNLTEFGLDASDVSDVVVDDYYVSSHTGTHHVFLQQRLDGIEVHNAIMSVAVSKYGKVAHVGRRFANSLVPSANRTNPSLTVIEAVESAADALGLGAPSGLTVLEQSFKNNRQALLNGGGISQENIPVHLVYQPIADGRLQLAWNVTILQLDGHHWWNARIDAESGSLLDKNDFIADASYEVYPIPIESPNHTVPLPPADARTIEVDPQNASSPFGWHDTDGVAGAEFTITRGNNTHAYADTDANNAPDGGANAEPDGGAALDFTGAVVPLDLTAAPSAYVQASIANLFYWTNVTHDVLYNYGFDEVSGNFQVNNYGNGGLGGDDVQAEGQDGAGNCNANFGTPADGARPRMQMFTCANTSPARDGDFDHNVIVHEYGHGVSNRLTGGPSNVSCLGNSEQMGEGWSDYLGLMLTMEAGDMGTDARGTGTYLFGQPPDGPGIRPAPYSTDFGVNSFTYSNISGVSVPHGVGFVFATMMWEMTWELIDEYGLNPDVYDDWTTGGNNLALQLVMDGMKLQACNPGFVDGRDAILAADDLLTGDGSPSSGANQCLIWKAFARRGLGLNADQGSSASVTDGTEDFTLPAFCDTIGATQPDAQVCRGDDAEYRIGVGESFTTPPVTLSTSGLPADTSAAFSPNPVTTVPGISDMTLSTGNGTPTGLSMFTVSGTDGTDTFNTTLTVDVFGGVPAMGPDLTSPTDEETGLPVLPTFEWDAVADAISYTLEIATDAAMTNIIYTADGLTGTTHTVTEELAFLTMYWWRITAVNPCGGTVSVVFKFTTLLFPGDCPDGATANVLFNDDLENGAPGWTSGGTQNTWTLSGNRTFSGANAFYAQDPSTLSDQRLVSPAVSLPIGEVPLTLQFQNYQIFETPNGDGRCWDAGILEVSTDGGTTWSQVPQEAMLTDPYDNILWNDTPGNNPISNDYGATDTWCAELEPWVASVVDISAWAGQTVNFGFRLGSDSFVGNEGWYLDDIKVQSCDDTVNIIFRDGFESGDTTRW